MFRRTFLSALPAAAQVAADAGWRVAPERPFPGSPVLFVLDRGPAEAAWMGRRLRFQQDEDWKGWVALGAVDLGAKPGPQRLEFADGTVRTVSIAPHAYRTSRLTVPPRFVQPPKEVAKRIAEEREIKKAVFAASGERRWQGRFAAPTATAQTSGFGTRRTYNGRTQSIHQGLDFRAAVGTPVRAANRGRVVIAREMYYEGGFVVVDHGEGLFTLYMHLSAFDVAEGDTVEKGQTLAASGDSGRVTGPHLHFGVQWQGLYMEPASLLAL